MTHELGTARILHRAADATDATDATDTVALGYEDRFLRRKRLETAAGASVLVDLPETVSLNQGDVLETETGARIAVTAAQEALLQVTGPDLTRLAWHIGNRHTPCQVEAGRLLIRRDHVLADMLGRLGATLTEVTAPFTPEGGAYGHGRTMGHDHGPEHGHSQGHDHSHAHDHAHDHPHTHPDPV
ncbi:MAG: urease accessory protein UreE [Rhodobacteraceae bacterium]|nr:urease accessory protein UreE [Paracoccaceae bacterium]